VSRATSSAILAPICVIAKRLACANVWPYVQHRGGPAGFLKILDETTLGFADFRGNRRPRIAALEAENAALR
jgi:hypothetical protein